MSASLTSAADDRRRQLAAATVGLAVVMSVLDGVMVNIALPSIGRDLHATPAASIWIVNAYQLAAALLLLPLGKLADIIGHRSVYLGCLAVFTLASAGCALSHDLVSLSLWRFAQGCGGAGIMGVTNAMLRFIYPPRLLARGIGINSVVVALALASGPTIASLIVSVAGWRWLFLVNLPIGAILLTFGARTLPATTGSHQRFDSLNTPLSVRKQGRKLRRMTKDTWLWGLRKPITPRADALYRRGLHPRGNAAHAAEGHPAFCRHGAGIRGLNVPI